MHTISARNVNEGWAIAKLHIWQHGQRTESRAGPVYRLPEPLAVRFEVPRERVLFDPARNANPFFHLMEALWMLGGRDDVAWVAQFNSRMSDFSDDGVILHGAYGHRWRQHFQQDQLFGEDGVVKLLQRDPGTRRAVLQMWDPVADQFAAAHGGRDVPCNLSVVFARRDEGLCMTVFNRSNDLAWGLFGANAVHMSVLQEVVAAAVGCGVGWYEQVTADAHAYEDHWSAPLPDGTVATYPGMTEYDPYLLGEVRAAPLVRDLEPWLDDLGAFLSDRWEQAVYSDPFFVNVARPMRRAWMMRRANPDLAAEMAAGITAGDWRRACGEWLARADTRREALYV